MSTKPSKAQIRKPSTAALEEAIKQLGPPSRSLAARQQSNLQQLIATNASNATLDTALKKAGWHDPMPMHTMGGWGSGSPVVQVARIKLLTQLLDALYLPTNDQAWYVRADHRYISGQVWGYGYALKETGQMRVNQYVDINDSSRRSTAGLYSQVITTPSDY